MIPTLLVLGLVLGVLIHDRTSFVRCSAVLVAGALVWGLVVGIADREVSTFVGGTAVALANLTAGASLSALIRTAKRWFEGKNTAATH